MKRFLTWSCFLCLSFWLNIGIAEPWIDTTDLQLRSDIELLSDIGVINVPITTYPLMWSGIIKELDFTDIQNVPIEYKSIFWRVKNAGKRAFSGVKTRKIKLYVSNSERVLREFGDDERGKAGVIASSSQIKKNFAWNFKVSRIIDPTDGENVSYEGSYLASVIGNWVVSTGRVEKWWGASWDSANLLSNNSKVPLGINVSRNYSNKENRFTNWLGSWSVSGFISKLERKRTIAKPIFSGLSFSTKFLDSLETSFRVTRLSGGVSTNRLTPKKDKTISGIDFRWSVPLLKNIGIPTSLYAGITDEGFDNFSTRILGASGSFNAFSTQWRAYLEHSDSKSHSANDDNNNFTYSDDYYQTGYRYLNRAIGSTYDSQSKALTLGLIGYISRYQSLELKLQSLNLNELLANNHFDNQHTVSDDAVKVKRLKVNWELKVNKNNSLSLELEASDRVFDSYKRQNERYRLQFGWTHFLN